MNEGAPRTTIVSFTDAKYFPLLRELCASIRRLYTPEQCAISVFDAGIGDQRLPDIKPYVQHIATPEWDLRNLPAHKKRKRYRKAFTCLPFLPRYFPGYEVYLWLDADCWVADRAAIELFIQGALAGRLAICLYVDRAYAPERTVAWGKLGQVEIRTFLYRHVKRAFGRGKAMQLAHYPELNTGAFALHRDAPHWEAWARWMEQAAPRARVNGIDQLAASMMIYKGGLPVELLPAWCNWTCARALPMADSRTGDLVEPFLPHHRLGVIHLAGLDAVRAERSVLSRLVTTDGGEIERSLRFTPS